MEPLGPDYDEAQERRHGLWGLGVLVMIALVVVSFIIIFTGGGSSRNNNNGTSAYGSNAFSDSSHSSGSAHSSAHPSQPGSSSSSSAAPAGCTDATCTAAVAGLADAINALRTQHGLAAVSASQSANAQACAAAHGGGSSCVPHYIYAQVSSTDGASVAKALEGVNASWLLAKDATRIEVGFAPAAGGRYDCAVLRFP